MPLTDVLDRVSCVADRSAQQTLIYYIQTRYLPGQSLGEGLHQEKEQMVSLCNVSVL